MPQSRFAVAVVLLCCLVSSGCLVCLDLSFLDAVPDLQASLEEGPACISPLEYLFLVLYGLHFGGGDDPIYNPPFLAPSGGGGPILQEQAESGLYTLTYGPEGAGRGRRIANEIRSLHAVVEPYTSARARYFDGEAPPPRRIFVSDADGASVAVFDPAEGSVVAAIRVGSSPRGMAFAPGGGQLYVANRGSSSVSVVDLDSLIAVDSLDLPGGKNPEGLAAAPDGSRLYVVNSAMSGELISLDPATGEVVETLQAGRMPTHVRVSPDGATAYLVNAGSGTIIVIDTLTFSRTGNIPVSGVTDLVVSADGTKLYATGGGARGKASEIDAATFKTLREWDLGEMPQSLTLTPDGLYLIASNAASDFSSMVPLFGGEVISLPAIEGLGPAAVVPIEAP